MMEGRLQSFLHWVETWFSQAQTTDEAEQLHRIPGEVEARLAAAASSQPPPERYIHWVREQVAQQIKTWQANPQHASNSLVIMGSPVEVMAPILTQSFKNDLPDELKHLSVIWPLEESPFARDRQTFEAQLLPNAEASSTSDSDSDSDSEDDIQVAIIPALDQCFLRCIQGWDKIESWQAQISSDRHRFWVLGCNHWVWVFLDRVCQISAYLERIEFLPKLDGESLQAWLTPLMAHIMETPDAADPDSEPDMGSDSYWQALASLSGGISTTAAGLWVRSLRLRTEDLPDEPGAIATTGDTDLPTLNYQLVKPTLPSLPSLDAFDWYLLHSLLLHGGMTRQHLALSLGESERQIRAHVQSLQNSGVLQEKGAQFQISPMHYPKLRSELANNNFLVGKV